MIEISHLTKKYGDHVAVDDLSFTVKPGKIYGFLGPNGAGKSTTMNIITGYLGATAGEVKINGYDIFAQPEEAKRCVGYLPELPPLYQEMTVLEYLNFVAELKKIKRESRSEQVEKVMVQTGITEMKRRLIRNLSKGYKQRVGLAQAILGDPEVIILDEPTVGLDPKQIIEMRDLIRMLGKKHTVILSSHILTEVSEVCDHIFIISKGKLVASDSTENLSRRMEGTPEIRLEIKGADRAVCQVLDTFKEAASYAITEVGEDGVVHVTVTAAKNTDPREKLFYAFAEKKLPILGMSIERKSLEDVFLKLTQENESGLQTDIETGLDIDSGTVFDSGKMSDSDTESDLGTASEGAEYTEDFVTEDGKGGDR